MNKKLIILTTIASSTLAVCVLAQKPNSNHKQAVNSNMLTTFEEINKQYPDLIRDFKLDTNNVTNEDINYFLDNTYYTSEVPAGPFFGKYNDGSEGIWRKYKALSFNDLMKNFENKNHF